MFGKIYHREKETYGKTNQRYRKSVVDFGVGWVVIYCLFFLYVGMCNDGANITAPMWPTAWGWSRATS